MEDLTTPRLILHPLTPAEAERLVARTPAPDDRWAPDYPTDGDVESAQDHLGHCATTGDPQPFGDYEIRRRDDGLVIGSLGFHRPPDAEGTVSIGYGVAESARGKGYAGEALSALLAMARDRGITRVKGDADLDNIASQRVMETAGMRFVGEDERVKYYETDWTPAETTGTPAAGARTSIPCP
ncbi:GNAT family N-acetyltransferase [Streptomyces sp. I05A-00742]|uniref:GNAT family N-acetyltransferase n=1 Tax=Streptomyces sp. I05A-00742 TaxID=2732853 RepID=UPI0014896A19|nr:GNAT family N-acetyltransferase [Streptomyces sp. I05A-00742]